MYLFFGVNCHYNSSSLNNDKLSFGHLKDVLSQDALVDDEHFYAADRRIIVYCLHLEHFPYDRGSGLRRC
jgi:hypothetical protein